MTKKGLVLKGAWHSNKQSLLTHCLCTFTNKYLALFALLGLIASQSVYADSSAPLFSGWGTYSSNAVYSDGTAACVAFGQDPPYTPPAYVNLTYVPVTDKYGNCQVTRAVYGGTYYTATVAVFYVCPSTATVNANYGTCDYADDCSTTYGPTYVRQSDGSCITPPSSIPVATAKQHVAYGKTCSAGGSSNSSILPTSPLAVGDPINAGTGDNMEAVDLYRSAGVMPLNYTLSYLSSPVGSLYAPTFEHGQQWVSNYDLKLNPDSVVAPNIAPANVYATRRDGQIIAYHLSSGSYVADSDISDTLTRLTDGSGNTIGWKRLNAIDDSIESYTIYGQLTSISTRAGLTLTINHDYLGNLSSIADALGRSIGITYDSQLPPHHISTITQPDNGTIQFGYDAANNLSTVTWPDTKVRQYVYENSSLPHSLTGILDENTSRFDTWTYDTTGRVTNEVQALGANQVTLSYGSGSTSVTDSLGTVRTMGISTILNQVHSTGNSQPAGSGCSASASSLNYDANGNVSSRTDFNGHMTTYVYDLTRNLETSRTEGLSSAGAVITGTTRTVTTSWHATWHLPLQIKEYAGGANSSGVPTSSTAVKQTTYTYDTKGNLSSVAVNDPALAVTRTTSITNTYSSILPGLVITKVINGPRTDISDITTLTFYDANDACIGCRGQLKTLTDSVGLITQFTSYDLNSNLLSMTDPNGLVTTNTYDARQRLLTQTVGTLVTSLQYDNVGQVTKLTLPDSSYLNYTYDAAHRLTQIQDAMGNKVIYTLDTEGNRISEQLKDPSGNLTKTLTRSYDALNRLQQLTGVGAQ